MLSLDEKLRVYDLLDARIAHSEIARRVGRSIGTIYNCQRKRVTGVAVADTEVISPKLAPVREQLDQLMKNGVTSSTKLYAAVQADGYTGSYGLLNSYVRRFSPKTKPYRRSQHIETGPGQQAQVDWGSFGKMMIGM